MYLRVRDAKVCDFCSTPLELLKETLSSDHNLKEQYLRSFGLNHEITSGLEKWHLSGHRKIPSIEDVSSVEDHGAIFEEHLRVCPICGWWTTFRETITTGRMVEVRAYAAIGALKVLDLTDVQAPLDEVRSYLAAKYESRFQLNPRLFEETVASVFRDIGYAARVTAYSGDDGIDVILDGPTGDTIGVQVKRYREKITVAQIRELTGALVINGLTRGIFVTTSDFQSGAQRTAALSLQHGVAIELVNAKRFFDALCFAQRCRYSSSDDEEAPFVNNPPRLIHWRSSDGRRSDLSLLVP